MPSILFSGGGTGGHLFPALAIAHAIGESSDHASGAACAFVCSDRAIDHSILSKAGVDFVASPARPFGLRPKPLARFAAAWGPAVRQSRALLRGDAKRTRPDVLIAMGGFVAAPSVQAARVARTPIVLVNLDAVPGKANRWCARHADDCLTAAEGADVPSGWTRVGPIVRPEARASASPEDARRAFDLDPSRRTLLVTGGSQGARSINQLIAALTEADPGAFDGWQLLHQCGPGESGEADALRARYDARGVPARVLDFIDRVGDAWASADLCVARAGAGTVAEVWANRVPTLFLPYPYHRDEHQKHNAQPLVESGGARLMRDAIDPATNLESIGPVLRSLLADDDARNGMRHALASLGPADGAEGVARAVSDLLGPAP